MKTISSGLSEALLGGVYEIPLWAGFIRCLKDAVGADHVVFAFRPPMRPTREWIILLSDHANLANFRESYDSFYPPDWLPPGIDLPEGRSHSLSAALASEGEETRQRHIDFLKLSGISAGRQMRVREPSGVEAWISVARHHGDFSAEHDMVLDDLAPILRGVLRLYATIERERFAALVSGDAIRRLHFGWVALDSDGCIVGSDEQAEQLLASSGVLRRGPSDKLVSDRLETGREIAATIQRFTRDRETSARALSISHDPWLEMLLLPINRTTIAIRKPAVAVAYLHGDNWGGANRWRRLAELFGLLPREAKLAFALTRGMSLTEAAQHFGWTESTARTYSKSIYMKTGARGLPDLVRLVMRSVVALAPDP